MIRRKLSEFSGGWFVGDFEPSAFRIPECEVAYKQHAKGEQYGMHYQRYAWEINYLIRGQILVRHLDGREERVKAGEVFIFPPGERYAAQPVFEEDCEVICVKSPSLPNDKVIV